MISQTNNIKGVITYTASDVVYTSLGRNNGIKDSALVFILSGKDTIGLLKVIAMSSKSSSGLIINSKRKPIIGDSVVTFIETVSPPVKQERNKDSSILSNQVLILNQTGDLKHPLFDFHGRISGQYYATLFDNPGLNYNQPGIILSMNCKFNEIPLKFDIYSNFRTSSSGTSSPFGSEAVNQSRIYRLSIEYDDSSNFIGIGRIISNNLPSIGYIDGSILSKSIGNYTFGLAFGFQPGKDQRSISTDYKKYAVYFNYKSTGNTFYNFNTAYSRTWLFSNIEREAVNFSFNLYSYSGFNLFAYSDIDLRQKSGNDFILSPILTNFYSSFNYNISSTLSLGLGLNAGRPFYPFSLSNGVPDSLMDKKTRYGMNLSINYYITNGISIYNNFNPRFEKNSSNNDYSNYSSINIFNIFSSGISARFGMNINSNSFTNSRGFSISVRKFLWNFIDLNIRSQLYFYKILQNDISYNTSTVGIDVTFFITGFLSLTSFFEKMQGYGYTSNSIFAELSWRF